MGIILKKYKFIIFVSFLIFLLSALNIKNSRVNSDSFGVLLTSQSIIENGTIKLDSYSTDDYKYQLHEKNGHKYYYFPLGSSISSLPFVFVATKLLPLDMTVRIHEAAMQKFITSLIAIAIVMLLYKIASFYLNKMPSMLIAFLFWLGTSLSSTLLTALWNQSFASLYAVIAVYLTLKIIKENNKNLWVLLAIVLFMAYLTRPTMSLMSVSIIFFLFLNNQKTISIKISLFLFAFLCLFSLFSFYEYNQLLPDYYLPKRLENNSFWVALYGNLLSPSRGILIFSPFLILFLINIDKVFFMFKYNKHLLLFAGWVILHLVAISKFPHWWGGWSYGPRFMMDVLIPIYYLFILLIVEIKKDGNNIRYKLNLFVILLTFMVSIFIHSYQGLLNAYTKEWNKNPNIDVHPEYLFDWSYPQFLHNEFRHIKRLEEFNKNNK